MIYPSIDTVIDIHNTVIEHSGGLTGIKDIGQLDSILNHIQNDIYYPTFSNKLTHLTYSIAKFHIFNDGNKRTSIASGAYFMLLNGYIKQTNLFIRGTEVPIIEAITNHISKEEFGKIIQIMIEET